MRASLMFFASLLVSPLVVLAQEGPAARAETLFLKGDYEENLKVLRGAGDEVFDAAPLAALEIRALMALGKYREAVQRSREALRISRFDPEVCLEAGRAFMAVGQRAQAQSVMENGAQMQPGLVAAENIRETVAYGELVLELKIDGKAVLERLLEPAKKASPESRRPYLAIGKLGLANHDKELAAENFREGLKRFPNDPDFAFGLAKSGVDLPRDRQGATTTSYVDVALRANPRHVEALLFKAEQLTGGKNFTGAKEVLGSVLAINPDHPEAWARRAAIAFLEEDPKAAENMLANAGKVWGENPRVEEIVGTTLAGQYRFAEGIGHLRKAHEWDPESTSIRFELGSNLLRFGGLDEGWRLIEQVHEADPYHVAAFNLITLRDKLAKYPVKEKDGVLLRMEPDDMAVFGSRALDLAVKAKNTFTEKYGVKLSQPVMVEVLPKQEDFAIRTFGLPGGESFLGVCFGPLITMTSPRGRLGRANWQALLWHEMAHTITLHMTRHRIPRWLSEGISVYEERQVRPAWGQGMDSGMREALIAKKIPSIEKLDEAFAGEDIMLGYYQSSLVVEFLIERFGMEKFRALLRDLGAGKPVWKSLAERSLPLPELNEAFAAYAKNLTDGYGSGIDWTPLTDEEYKTYRDDPAAWVSKHPDRYATSMMRVTTLLQEGQWKEARAIVEKVIAAAPMNREKYNPYQALAQACRGMGDTEGERAALTKLLDLDANAPEPAARLVELGGGLAACERMLEINPFSEKSYRTMIGLTKDAAKREAYVSLLALNPGDAGRLHYELATLIGDSDPKAARRYVLKALEENPRFRNALDFLVSLPATP